MYHLSTYIHPSGFYIDNVEGDRTLVDPVLTRPGPGNRKVRWSQQFLQGRTECGSK